MKELKSHHPITLRTYSYVIKLSHRWENIVDIGRWTEYEWRHYKLGFEIKSVHRWCQKISVMSKKWKIKLPSFFSERISEKSELLETLVMLIKPEFSSITQKQNTKVSDRKVQCLQLWKMCALRIERIMLMCLFDIDCPWQTYSSTTISWTYI